MRNKSVTGFTLIELMIIVAIISILTVIALPKFGKMVQKAKEGRTKGSLGAFRSAVNIYYADNEGYLPLWNKIEEIAAPAGGGGINFSNPLWDFFVPQYINEIPCVFTGQKNAWGAWAPERFHEGSNRIGLVWVKNMIDGAVNDAVAGNARHWASYDYLYYICENGPVYPDGKTYNGHIWINCDLMDTKGEKILLW